jgi:hypothetical protein
MKTLGVILAFVLLAGCAPSAASVGTAIAQTQAADVAAHSACTVATVLKFTTTSNDVAKRWDDGATLANSTPRSNLSGQIANLRSLKREAEAVETPTCLKYAQTFLVSSMDDTVTAFIDFLGQATDTKVTSDFDAAKRNMQDFHNEIDKINKCVPNCP